MITVAGKVRDAMGIDKEIAIDDEQIVTLIGIAEKRIRRDLFTFNSNVQPGGNPSSGIKWNGNNTSFKVSNFIMDYDFDQSTSNDVTGYWIDSSYDVQTATVVVTNARYGRITITQSDGSTAIPASAKDIRVDYYSSDEDIPFAVLEELGTLLTAHYITLRLTEPRKISLADLENNRRILEVRNNQFVNEYKTILRGYREVMLEAT